MKKMLIVYYSWSNGNTERVAGKLQQATGGDCMETSEADIGAWAEKVKSFL